MLNKDASFFVGFFLAVRDVKRSNIWTTLLVIFVMSLTFFNMLLMGGLLMGITAGMEETFKDYYSSNIRISPASEKSTIYRTQDIIKSIENLPELKNYSLHYSTQAILEYGYKTKLRQYDLTETASGQLIGIDPKNENQVTQLSSRIIDGEYLLATDVDQVLLGKDLLQQYSSGTPDSGNSNSLVNVKTGSRIRLTVAGVQREVTVKGVISTKNRTVDSRIYMTDLAVRNLTNNPQLNVNEIIISLTRDDYDSQVKEYLLASIPNPDEVIIQTAIEAIPSASADINKTFALLSNIVGVIALIVGAITIFIVIFVNAITRRKYIGILKGIGISTRAIQISYVIQSLLYAASGIFFGSIVIMLYLKPYLNIHPISMPISDGSLAVTYVDLLIKGLILMTTALISGFIPAWLVTRQNTLDAILGR